jgi:hypothetical protein
MQEDQKKMPMHEKPKLLVEDIARKIGDLDREVKYLMNKLKTFRPKPKPKAENKTAEATNGKTNTTSKKDSNKTKGEFSKVTLKFWVTLKFCPKGVGAERKEIYKCGNGKLYHEILGSL